ncbi:MAG: hypothetical protein JST50_05420 [Bacteroidetes bacterium]|jgi:hypothetical protein|nr:hypothetical protein [Bacteroidota bacterium]
MILPDNPFHTKILPNLASAVAETKAEVEDKIKKLNRPGMENEFAKLVSLTNFLNELEKVQANIKEIKRLKA